MADTDTDSVGARVAASERELLASSDGFLNRLAQIDVLEQRKRLMSPDDEERLPLALEIEDLSLALVGMSRYQTRLVEMAGQSVGVRQEAPRRPGLVLSEWRDAERTLRDARDAVSRASDAADRLRDEHGRAVRHYTND